jgi:hypothetical protein
MFTPDIMTAVVATTLCSENRQINRHRAKQINSQTNRERERVCVCVSEGGRERVRVREKKRDGKKTRERKGEGEETARERETKRQRQRDNRAGATDRKSGQPCTLGVSVRVCRVTLFLPLRLGASVDRQRDIEAEG